jgi:Cdc6-like AAA superfamily ATPase
MEELNLNKILNREQQEKDIKNILKEFEANKTNLLFKKGIYVYGDPGTGKTSFVTNILKDLNYDIIRYDAGDIRNAAVIEDIAKHNMSDKNIMSLFNKKIKKIAIIMDEIDGMNNGDKGGINSLIKLIRPKKTKKQKLEEVTMNPIICIGNYRIDKKIKELMKGCNTIELKTPNQLEISNIISELMPSISSEIKTKLISYIQGDLRKLNNMYNFNKNKPQLFTSEIIDNVFQIKSYNDDTKKITNKLINQQFSLKEHNKLYHETFKKINKYDPSEVRFTKVLTKYSTEYNNSLFIQKLCQKLGMDKKDLFGFFIELSNKHEISEIVNILENYEIVKLDINRIYRYIEKYIKENATGTTDKEVDEEDSYELEDLL